MIKIPFKVSARTARLIGRENIASSKGAIIELVKNAYDADSPVCIVYFNIKYTNLHDFLSEEEFLFFKQNNPDLSLFYKVYKKSDNNYQILEDADNEDKALLRKEFYKLNALYIIDAGEGMTQQVIREHWMTIGTDYKANNIFTKNGRVRAGAKGIGRFALDKLGDHTEMITVFKNEFKDCDEDGKQTDNSGYCWKVSWSDFEGELKTIDSVDAELTEFNESQIKNYIQDYIQNQKINDLIEKYGFEHGTILKITDLRDNWEDFYIDQIYSDLEVLVPPKENNDFNIYLYSSSEENKYGEVLGSVCDDFDYKLVAKADKDQNVMITVYRNEYDLDLIPPDFFLRKALTNKPYRKKEFTKKKWKKTTTFSQLLPGFANIDEEHVFNDIGIFEFTLYFMKRTYSTPDADKFFYRRFRSNERKDWLNKYSGIKLFRDNFRVRPYGEINNSSFDWLGLGSRKTQSPAGMAKKSGGYKVNPENITGTIKISRLTNVNFEDKSSREGLQENKTFLIFKKLIAGIISVFEDDRSYIAREMSSYYDEKYSDIINKQKSEVLAKLILDKEIKKRKENIGETSSIPSNEFILAELNKKREEEIEKLKDEQIVLRGLASSGIVMASFTHELSNLDDVLETRIDDLKDMIISEVSEKLFENVPDYLNPFVMLEDMKKQDSKIQNWLRFSIGTAKKDKRTRKILSIKSYFENFKTTWEVVLNNRNIDFSFEIINDIEMRIFEIDLDSIFNNLLVNSIDAFLISKEVINRKISINIIESPNDLRIDYYDNGSGLSKDIMNPTDIFKALFTTKRNQYTGEEEGTGLGMWLVKTISEDNDAAVKLLFPENGFGIRFLFPIKYKRPEHV